MNIASVSGTPNTIPSHRILVAFLILFEVKSSKVESNIFHINLMHFLIIPHSNFRATTSATHQI
jgi:hypothetical protein